MGAGAWWAAVHGVAKTRTWLSDFTFTIHFHALEKDMATNFSVLAWRIPGTGKPGWLPSMGSHRVEHDWSDLAAAVFSTLFILSSVQFSRSVMSNSLQPHESQHARPPCASPTPGVHSNSHPSSRWCHPAISSSVVPFSSCPNPSQHQSLFQWVNSSHEVAKVLEFQL